jgi:hypothetical protein
MGERDKQVEVQLQPPPPHLHPSIYFLDMVVDELAYVPARTHLGRGSVVDVCMCVGGGGSKFCAGAEGGFASILLSTYVLLAVPQLRSVSCVSGFASLPCTGEHQLSATREVHAVCRPAFRPVFRPDGPIQAHFWS